MNKKTLIISVVVVLAIALFSWIFYSKPSSVQSNGGIALFYSVTCPHCQKVEEFLSQNNVADKVSFEQKSIDNNSQNISELKDRASVCGLDGNIGIPFLWDGTSSKCLMGDIDIINFFKEKINPAPFRDGQ